MSDVPFEMKQIHIRGENENGGLAKVINNKTTRRMLKLRTALFAIEEAKTWEQCGNYTWKKRSTTVSRLSAVNLH